LGLASFINVAGLYNKKLTLFLPTPPEHNTRPGIPAEKEKHKLMMTMSNIHGEKQKVLSLILKVKRVSAS